VHKQLILGHFEKVKWLESNYSCEYLPITSNAQINHPNSNSYIPFSALRLLVGRQVELRNCNKFAPITTKILHVDLAAFAPTSERKPKAVHHKLSV